MCIVYACFLIYIYFFWTKIKIQLLSLPLCTHKTLARLLGIRPQLLAGWDLFFAVLWLRVWNTVLISALEEFTSKHHECLFWLNKTDIRKVLAYSNLSQASTVGFLGQFLLRCGSWPVHYPGFGSLPGLYPLGSSSIAVASFPPKTGLFFIFSECLLGGKLLQLRTSGIKLPYAYTSATFPTKACNWGLFIFYQK